MDAKHERNTGGNSSSSAAGTRGGARRGMALLGGLAVLFWLGAAQAQAESRVEGSTVVYHGPGPGVWSDVYDQASPGLTALSHGTHAVNVSNFDSWAHVRNNAGSGYAFVDPLMQTLRASSAITSGWESTAAIYSKASFTSDVLIGAGTSGLAYGTPITLSFQFRVDGSQVAGNHITGPVSGSPPDSYGSGATAQTLLNYRVFDLNGDAETAALHFSYTGKSEYYYSHTPTNRALLNYSYSSAEYMTDGGWNSSHYVYKDDSIDPITGNTIGVPSARRESYDTGLITVTLDSFVGHTLRVAADLQSNGTATGYSPMKALSDYGSTFDAEISSNVAGIQLSGIAAGIAPVPEPGTVGMFVAGLAVVGGLAWRRRPQARATAH
jgi:hypothetical protein